MFNRNRMVTVHQELAFVKPFLGRVFAPIERWGAVTKLAWSDGHFAVYCGH
jgi:hypothetical protein